MWWWCYAYDIGHTQFYDKFNIRYQLQQILRFLWDIKPHRETFVRESNNTQVFQRFGDNVLNDGIFLLDEALLKLEEIHKLELAMANQAEWNAQPPVRRSARLALPCLALLRYPSRCAHYRERTKRLTCRKYWRRSARRTRVPSERSSRTCTWATRS